MNKRTKNLLTNAVIFIVAFLVGFLIFHATETPSEKMESKPETTVESVIAEEGYCTVSAFTLNQLSSKVSEKIREGLKCQGGISEARFGYAQAMIR
jgi:hypothetical protein